MQLLVLKEFRISCKPKHEQIFKQNYTFSNNNEFKNEINQIDIIEINEIIKKGEISHWQTMDWYLLTTFNVCQRCLLYKIAEKFLIHAEYIVLSNGIKIKTKQAKKKLLSGFVWKK